jgi:RimJ/RimL family protein N-acetyltransferase
MGRTVLLAPLLRMQGKGKNRAQKFPPEERFGVVIRESEDLIGEVNYCNYSPMSQEVEIGIEIDYMDRGKGYGEDALYHFLDYLFFTMQVVRIKLSVVVSNQQAHKLYEKLGFRDLKIVKAGGYDVECEELVDVLMMVLDHEQWVIQRQGYSFK